jgi:hypothetical protein
MSATDTAAAEKMDSVPSADAKEDATNAVNNVDSSPSPKKAKSDENAGSDKKQRRSSGRKSRCDIDIMEEARAAYGDIDASEGRRLRKRPEPPKVEKTTPPPPKAAMRKSGGTPRGRKKADNAAADEEKKEVEENSDKQVDVDKKPTEETKQPELAEDKAVNEDGVDGNKEAADNEKKPVQKDEIAAATTEPETNGGLAEPEIVPAAVTEKVVEQKIEAPTAAAEVSTEAEKAKASSE